MNRDELEQLKTGDVVKREPGLRALDREWAAVSAHLRLVNLVRARIGQRPLGRHSGYTPADVRADAEFYASTQSWARQRADEIGLTR